MPTNDQHIWKFFRVGGLDQVSLETVADLADLGSLDPKLWVALSCPVKGLEFDSRTLEMIDLDNDGRVRLPEVVTAVNHVVAHLKDPAEIIKGVDGLKLSSIKDSDDAGRTLVACARRALAVLGKPGEQVITVDDVCKAAALIPKARNNGDGILPPEEADDEALRLVLSDIVKVMGGEMDLSGRPGVSAPKADAFYAALADFNNWWSAGEASERAGSGVLPLGADTPKAFTACKAVVAKVDDYFARCRVAEFDPRAVAAMNRSDSEYVAMAAKDMSAGTEEVAAMPLQQVAPRRPLNLQEGVNPAWAARITAFGAETASRVLGHPVTSLTEADWQVIKVHLAPYEGWLNSKKGGVVEPLGIARIREILAGNSKAAIAELIAADAAPAAEVAALGNLERLARYNRDLYKLLRNFVNFADFYDPNALSIFDAGRLYLDQRTSHLCIRVQDIGAHSGIASMSGLYLAYCNCTRPTGETMTVLAAMTQGDSDYLMVGRRGIFFDRKGRDWDAQIMKVVESPISLRQAFWSPYKRIAKFIHEKVESFAAAKDRESHEKAIGGITKTAEVAASAKPAKEGFDIAKFAGIFAALGLGIGMIGAALVAVVGGFAKLAWWQMPVAIFGVMLIISLPSVILAWLRLRSRTLGPVLEGNGWAINGRVKINIPLGTSLTKMKKLPKNSKIMLDDPFEDKKAKRMKIIIFIVLVLAVAAYIVWELNKSGIIDIPFLTSFQAWLTPAPAPTVVPTPPVAPTPVVPGAVK